MTHIHYSLIHENEWMLQKLHFFHLAVSEALKMSDIFNSSTCQIRLAMKSVLKIYPRKYFGLIKSRTFFRMLTFSDNFVVVTTRGTFQLKWPFSRKLTLAPKGNHPSGPKWTPGNFQCFHCASVAAKVALHMLRRNTQQMYKTTHTGSPWDSSHL